MNPSKDYGHNGKEADGLFTMHPSGDRVTKEECDRRLAHTRRAKPVDEILGMSWDQLESRQGGKLNRKGV